MSSFADTFGFFDRSQEYTVAHGQLPHWYQTGATCFITWRTSDSIPAKTWELWERQRADALSRLGIDAASTHWKAEFSQLDWSIRQRFQRQLATKLELALDELHGKCELRDPRVSRMVADSLLWFDGKRYDLGGFVVMPNHVHVLVCFHNEADMMTQCTNWKHYTSRQINERLGKQGHFWQSESFDHLVRDADHFVRFRKYICQNPRKAGLGEHEYRLYLPELGLADL